MREPGWREGDRRRGGTDADGMVEMCRACEVSSSVTHRGRKDSEAKGEEAVGSLP